MSDDGNALIGSHDMPMLDYTDGMYAPWSPPKGHKKAVETPAVRRAPAMKGVHTKAKANLGRMSGGKRR